MLGAPLLYVFVAIISSVLSAALAVRCAEFLDQYPLDFIDRIGMDKRVAGPAFVVLIFSASFFWGYPFVMLYTKVIFPISEEMEAYEGTKKFRMSYIEACRTGQYGISYTDGRRRFTFLTPLGAREIEREILSQVEAPDPASHD